MKINFTRKGALAPSTVQLTRQEIEQQAVTDFNKYARLFHQRHNRAPSYPIDVDHMAQELWGASVSYQSIPQTNPDEEVLGFYNHAKKEIVVDPERCKNDARTTFTVAHELGHLSLHGWVMAFPQQLAKHKKNNTDWRLEWQATRYAVSILAPKQTVFDVLSSMSLVQSGIVVPVDLALHAQAIQSALGLSRQALEIRLEELGVSSLNKKYE